MCNAFGSLAKNQICGVDDRGQGTYTVEGINALCDAIKSATTLTSLNLDKNQLTNSGLDMSAILKLAEALPHSQLTSLSVDGHALPIDELKGTKPVESIDLSRKRLEDPSGIIIAACIKENAVLKELKCAARPLCAQQCQQPLTLCVHCLGSLASNYICGVNWRGDGKYTAEGINALCDALKGNNTLTNLNLAGNQLWGLDKHGHGTYTTEGIDALCEALKGNNTITSLKYAGHLESIPTWR